MHFQAKTIPEISALRRSPPDGFSVTSGWNRPLGTLYNHFKASKKLFSAPRVQKIPKNLNFQIFSKFGGPKGHPKIFGGPKNGCRGSLRAGSILTSRKIHPEGYSGGRKFLEFSGYPADIRPPEKSRKRVL